ncbi:hypothetical protein NDU88_007406 [Pleurodeles waltl]|uniref:Uncharacterized protein n=1 Tax=Pleurodeles waltl TaxID=8319 RepID=A0AAV7PTY7_PLEWA|nr:hypothetical protein NDU88_007406 [Pleurodeles waltl]
MEITEANGELDLEEIIKAATTRSKDWILKQIKGAGSGAEEAREGLGDSSTTNAAGSNIKPHEPKKRQRNASRGAKREDTRETGEPADAATPGPSKKAKTSNGEQISIIVKECLKSMAPLLFTKQGGGQDEKEPRDPEVREGSGEEGPAPLRSPARPIQAWGAEPTKTARR